MMLVRNAMENVHTHLRLGYATSLPQLTWLATELRWVCNPAGTSWPSASGAEGGVVGGRGVSGAVAYIYARNCRTHLHIHKFSLSAPKATAAAPKNAPCLWQASERERETAASGIECRIVCCVLVCAASAAASSTARAPVAFKFQLKFSFTLFASVFFFDFSTFFFLFLVLLLLLSYVGFFLLPRFITAFYNNARNLRTARH